MASERNSAKVKGLIRKIKIKSCGAAEDLYSRRCFSSCSDPPASPTLSRWKPAASLQKQLRLRKRNDVKGRFHVSAQGGLGGWGVGGGLITKKHTHKNSQQLNTDEFQFQRCLYEEKSHEQTLMWCRLSIFPPMTPSSCSVSRPGRQI